MGPRVATTPFEMGTIPLDGCSWVTREWCASRSLPGGEARRGVALGQAEALTQQGRCNTLRSRQTTSRRFPNEFAESFSRQAVGPLP